MSMRPQITIEVNPKHFIFSHGGEKLALDTIVSVREDDRKTIVAMGEAPKEAGILSVSLFDADQKLPQNTERIDFLSAFIGYGMEVVLPRKPFSLYRARVVFHGDSLLGRVLCGYQRTLLETAALNGGAKEVVFD